jgi:hypothetical protein
MFTETIPALLGIMFMGGFVWKRANRWGAAASIFAAFVVYYALNFLMTCKMPDGPADSLWPVLQYVYACWESGGLCEFLGSGQLMLVAHWKGGPFGCAMLAGFAAFVVVSLTTRAESSERIARFFEKMRHSSDNLDSLATRCGTRTAASGKDLILLDLPGWLTADRWRGFFHRYREDLLGFVLAWGTVVVLVLMAWGLMQIGR